MTVPLTPEQRTTLIIARSDLDCASGFDPATMPPSDLIVLVETLTTRLRLTLQLVDDLTTSRPHDHRPRRDPTGDPAMREHPADAKFMDALEWTTGQHCVVCDRTDVPVADLGTVTEGPISIPVVLCRPHLGGRLELDRFEARDRGEEYTPRIPIFT